MNRRRFVAAVTALAMPSAARPQQAPRVRRIGYLSNWKLGELDQQMAEALRRVGYEEGRNLIIERRHAVGDAESLALQAQQLARLNVELIVAFANDAISAAKRATETTPIVIVLSGLPVEAGYVRSLARPGANITGTAWNSPETAGKKVQFLKEVAPGLKRLAVLWNPDFPGLSVYRDVTERAAADIGLSVQFFGAARREDVTAALKGIAASRADLLYAMLESVLWTQVEEIVAFTVNRKLPSLGATPWWVDVGGLMYYGPQLQPLVDRTATYVDRILRGAKPADLPVELPTKYEFVVNLRAAHAIGYAPSATMLLRADRVIK